ncbi:MAG: acetyl-CoA carboxylase biotin carboxylase subunit [Deltaproteobacteria bacterium]|nr:acetyl-CoA carboxylase biotin carboxylase subunit [Deltaproteobacteria bacterium]
MIPRKPITKLLIANRGEIALRIAKTARRMGIKTVGVYSDADSEALYLNYMDEKVRLGPPPPRESYLQIEKILAAVEETKADGVHPGYGFISENADFAMRVAGQGVSWVGPPPDAVRKMGSKIGSRDIARAHGVPLVPGSDGAVKTFEEAKAVADRVGYPVMVKASGGGGGIGLVRVEDESTLARTLEDASKKAATFFGDPSVFIEKYILRPRHIEVQVFGDKHGQLVHMGERECSIQRRNQKVIEETPSPIVTAEKRKEMGDAALRLAKAVGYTSSGTVEFVADQQGNFYFLEMNTRLQVEHTVTEMVLGQDLVEWQLRVAGGEELPLGQSALQAKGHAIQFRICAEDPEKRFAPSPGAIEKMELPAGEGVRCDFGFAAGTKVTPYYDSLIGKLVVHGKDRQDAIEKAKHALNGLVVVGIKTNIELHKKVLATEQFLRGELSTAFLSEVLQYKW